MVFEFHAAQGVGVGLMAGQKLELEAEEYLKDDRPAERGGSEFSAERSDNVAVDLGSVFASLAHRNILSRRLALSNSNNQPTRSISVSSSSSARNILPHL
ncbi:uncharacterized protein UDID_18022 [Ustilago sp. UG-2017a]|nr:uncharacterized protein UDID_18022 [Ustilago sp. UG-2017a]